MIESTQVRRADPREAMDITAPAMRSKAYWGHTAEFMEACRGELTVKAELARVGHSYATESMLLLDPETGQYDASATPEDGRDTLFDYYRRVISGRDTVERGGHAVFRDG